MRKQFALLGVANSPCLGIRVPDKCCGNVP